MYEIAGCYDMEKNEIQGSFGPVACARVLKNDEWDGQRRDVGQDEICDLPPYAQKQ
jgi:hypothetical protein